MALVIVILVLLLALVFFYLKCSMMQSFMTLGSAVLATIITFSYYEWLANLFISRGYGQDLASCGCFILLFIAAFALLRSVSELLIAVPIELGNVVKMPVVLICGLFTGLIISGNLLVAMGLLPMHGKVFYSRFDPDGPVVLKSPQAPTLSTDGFVAGFYRQISSGSMSSDKSFGVFHTDFLSQIHLNKLKTKEGVLSVCSREALVLPKGKTKKPVRLKKFDGQEITIVRVGIQAKDIKDGGVGKEVKFFPAQIRLIVKETPSSDNPLSGTAEALYPIGLWKNGAITNSNLDEIITPDPQEFNKRVCWIDVAFQSSKSKTPVLLQFKQNAVIELPEAVDSTPEIEQALEDDEEQKEESL